MAENGQDDDASPVPKVVQLESSIDDTLELETKEVAKEEETTTLPARPIKRARTAYFIFADDKRAEIAAQHPGEGVGAVARVMGQLWSSLGENDRAVYQQRAAEERERVSKEVEKYKDALPEVENPIKSPTATLLPAARIRKICKLDPEVKGVSKEALQLITKCAELMTVKLGTETQKVAQLQNRRTILPDDVAHVCSNREQFLFLREDIRDLYQEQVSYKAASTKTRPQAPSAGKPLTDYFQHQK